MALVRFLIERPSFAQNDASYERQLAKKFRLCSPTNWKKRRTVTSRCYLGWVLHSRPRPCDTPRAVLDASTLSRLRAAAFLATAVGALLIGIGALRPWVTVGFGLDTKGVLDSTVVGTDVSDGKFLLAVAVGLLIGIGALRLLRSRTARRVVSALMLLGGLAAAGIAITDLARLDQRFAAVGVEAVAKTVSSQLHIPLEQASHDLSTAIDKLGGQDISPEAGLLIVIAGGFLAALGGGLSLAWVSQRGDPGTSAELGSGEGSAPSGGEPPAPVVDAPEPGAD